MLVLVMVQVLLVVVMSTTRFLEGDVNGSVFGTSGPVAAEWIGACCAIGHGFFVLFWLAEWVLNIGFSKCCFGH